MNIRDAIDKLLPFLKIAFHTFRKHTALHQSEVIFDVFLDHAIF